MLRLSFPISLSLFLSLAVGCSKAENYDYQPTRTYSGSTKTDADIKKDGSPTKKRSDKGDADSNAMPDAPPADEKDGDVVADPDAGTEPDPVMQPIGDDSNVRASKGSGGGTGSLEIPWTDSTGLASSYKINVPTDASSKVYGLHIHLHGDGGGGYKDFPNKELRYELIGVSVKAPNQGMTWGRNAGKAHALYLNELIQNELVKKYNIDLDKIIFSTVSGGSYFITGNFIPEYGHIYQSKAFVMCGGETPRVAFKDPSTLAKFRIHWEYTKGERSDIVPSIERSIAAYKKAALEGLVSPADQARLQTASTSLEGEHCVFDNKAYTSGIQKSIDDEFKIFMGE